MIGDKQNNTGYIAYPILEPFLRPISRNNVEIRTILTAENIDLHEDGSRVQILPLRKRYLSALDKNSF